MGSLSDLLSQAGNGGFNPLAFLAGLGGGQQPPAPSPQTAVPQAAPIDPTGASILAPAAPGNVLARLQTGAPTPPPVTVPHIFSGAPDVRGMSRGAAFASGLSGGLADASKQGLLAQQAASQNFQNNLELYKTLFQQKNTEASQAETAKRDEASAAYQRGLLDPELQGKLASAKETDEVAAAEERGKVLAKIDEAHGLPEGTTAKTPEGTEFYATSKWPTKPQGAGAPLNPTEEKGVLASNTKIDALRGSLDTLKQAQSILDSGDIYTGLEAKTAMAAANNLPGSIAGMAVDMDKAARTSAYDTAIKSASLAQFKEFFGPRVTNYEERVGQNLTPSSGMSMQAIRQILPTLIQRREAALAGEYQTLDDIKSRKMFQAGYRAPNPYENWDSDKDLNLGKSPAATPSAPNPVRKAAAPPPSNEPAGGGGMGAAAAPSPLASIPPGAIKKLQANPDKRADFDAMFGPGASNAVLGAPK